MPGITKDRCNIVRKNGYEWTWMHINSQFCILECIVRYIRNPLIFISLWYYLQMLFIILISITFLPLALILKNDISFILLFKLRFSFGDIKFELSLSLPPSLPSSLSLAVSLSLNPFILIYLFWLQFIYLFNYM